MVSVLFPVLKSSLKDEFLSIWDKWFVLEDTVEDEKTPGKLKGFYIQQNTYLRLN